MLLIIPLLAVPITMGTLQLMKLNFSGPPQRLNQSKDSIKANFSNPPINGMEPPRELDVAAKAVSSMWPQRWGT